jgi:hypothetical protein
VRKRPTATRPAASDAQTRRAALYAFVAALAGLYADLWFSGKLDQIRKESLDDEEDG